MSIIKKVISKCKLRENPVTYWRQLGAKIGNGCEIYASASLGSEPYLITIGNHVRVNSGVRFVTHDGGVWVLRGLAVNNDRYSSKIQNADLFGNISVGDNVHIGINSIIMPGVSIGDNCIIGCGAIVTRSIPSGSIAVGIPARVIETVEEYYLKHSADFDFTKTLSQKQKKNYLLEKYKK